MSWFEVYVLTGTSSVIGGVGGRIRESAREVEEDMAEDDIGRGDVEARDWMVEWVVLQRVGVGLEVWEVVGELG